MIPVRVICAQCGAEFIRARWKVAKAEKAGTKMFCGTVCGHAARRSRTPEDRAAYHAAYRAARREHYRQYNKDYRADHYDELRARKLERYWQNIEDERRRAREYAAAHPEAARERHRRWRTEKPDKQAFHIARSNLAKKHGLKPREVPRDIVEAHLEYLNILRWLSDNAQGMVALPETGADTGSAPKGDQPGRPKADAPNLSPEDSS